jgi:hypothetical protein
MADREAELIRAGNQAIYSLEARNAVLKESLERLIVAVEWEVPPIRDGVEVERRLDILAQCAEEARKTLIA